MRKYFGTDGVRGIANIELTPILAYKIGKAGATILKKFSSGNKIIIGTDTRISKDLLLTALASGIMSVGIDVIDVGVAPTPAVAYLTKKNNAIGGVVISASHNPMEYNGIKFFNSNGLKLDDNIELDIEKLIDDEDFINNNTNSNENIGRFFRENIIDEYVDFLVSQVNDDFKGLNITLDCANGAAYEVAPKIFEKLGAKINVINNAPNGVNINKNAGSTNVKGLIEATLKNKSDIGLAYDGDADRLIAVDEQGKEVDGDVIMLLFAKYLKEKNQLKNNTLVVTVMSNLGLHISCKEFGIDVLTTAVGDRYVLEKMLEKNCSIGGEQSGHMIFLDYNTTGDGILSSLFLVKLLKEYGQSMSNLSNIMQIYPQVLINAKVKNDKKELYKTDLEILDKINELEKKMDGKGRVLIRHSGTEPLVRVMIEGQDISEITKYAEDMSKFIEEKLG